MNCRVQPLGEADLAPLAEGLWREHLGPGGPVVVRRLSQGQYVDSPTVFVVTVAGAARAVISAASPVAPRMVERTAERTQAARSTLSAIVPHRVLEPLAVAQVRGIGCALVPYCEALSSHRLLRRWTHRRVASPLFDWLLDVARVTRHAAPGAGWIADASASLQAMATRPGLEGAVREAAARAGDALAAGRWQPQAVLMHGDLWRGNVMRHAGLAGAPGGDLVVIDWAGCQPEGWPLFDLVRLADSLGQHGHALRRQIDRHCEMLGTTHEQGRHGVAAALAGTLARLENFPLEHFAAMARRALSRFDEATRAR